MLGVSTSWSTRDLPRPGQGQLYLYLFRYKMHMLNVYCYFTLGISSTLSCANPMSVPVATSCWQDRQCTYKRSITDVSRNYCWRGKVISVKHYECVFVALVTPHAKRTRHITLSFMASQPVQYCPHYFLNGTIVGKMLLNIKCVFWFSVQCLSKTFWFQEEFSEILSEMYVVLLAKHPLLLLDINGTLIFWTD
jgi:hypothetical protein